MESKYGKTISRFDSIDSSDSSGSSISFRERSRSLWRPSSLVNLVNPRKNRLLNSSKSIDRLDDISKHGLPNTDDDKLKYNDVENRQESKKGWDTIVNIILVEAKGLPDAPSDGLYHSLYFKIRLGSETYKSKSVSRTRQPEWKEKLKLHLRSDHLLKITLWDRGTQRNFMGGSVTDLSKLDKDRTYDLWEMLDDGFGSIHLNITLCTIRNNQPADNELIPNWDFLKEKFALFNLSNTDWKVVGNLHVKVISAKGLSGKPNAYCTLEVDNEKVQTHSLRGTSEPAWEKNYVFNIYDITTTLDLAVYDSSSVIALRNECIGQVSIPLLRLKNGELQWFALKNKSKRAIASGNCPRVLLETHLVWNTVKATLKLFRPKEVKYLKKSPRFSPELLYHNVGALSAILDKGTVVNEHIMLFLEWENRELSTVVLIGWLVFWYIFEWWMAPLILLIPFIYYWRHYYQETQYGSTSASDLSKIDDDPSFLEVLTGKNNDLADKVQRVPEIALVIKKSVDFIIMSLERVYNLVRFKVPFLSYFVMIALIVLSIAMRFIKFKHVMIALGLYKYMRKYLNPERKPNNDVLDFLSRIPDNNTLKEWKALSVPEPIIRNEKGAGNTLGRSHSS